MLQPRFVDRPQAPTNHVPCHILRLGRILPQLALSLLRAAIGHIVNEHCHDQVENPDGDLVEQSIAHGVENNG